MITYIPTFQDIITKGDDYDLTIWCQNRDGTPRDLTGGTVRSKIKNYYQDSLVATPNVSIANALSGVVLYHIPANTTESIDSPTCKSDIEFVSADGDTCKLAQFRFVVDEESTL